MCLHNCCYAGNTFSRTHVKYTDQDPDFWRISVDDMAISDVPASVEYIKGITGQKVCMVHCCYAHSVTTVFLALWNE